MPVGFPVTVEPGTRVLRPVGLSRITQGLPQDITSPGLSREAKSSESAKVKAARFGPTSEERTLKPEST